MYRFRQVSALTEVSIKRVKKAPFDLSGQAGLFLFLDDNVKMEERMDLKGVWLPVVTPFYKGEVDYDGYRRLLEHYLEKGIHGIIPLGTTGESPVISEGETIRIIMETVSVANGRVPVFAGVNMLSNEMVFKLAESDTIVGIKDSCGGICFYLKSRENLLSLLC